MSEPEQNPTSDRHAAGRVSRRLVRDLAIVFVIIALGFGFGRPLADGYYFGGCDDAQDVQQYATHVFGIAMCRDVTLTSKAESKAQREAGMSSVTELFEGERAGATEDEGGGAAQSSTPPSAASGGGRA
jgi:hypothetical protein